MTKKYAVGEILYLISNRQRQVLPLQVEEEINRKTLRGENVSYRVRLPGADKSVDISSLQGHGEIIASIDAVRAHLEGSARRAIEEVLQDAIETAAASFDVESTGDVKAEIHAAAGPVLLDPGLDSPEIGSSAASVKKDSREKKIRTEVVLPDGTRAKLLHHGVQ
jgi:hypothetical protein